MNNYQGAMHIKGVVLNGSNAFSKPFLFVFESTTSSTYHFLRVNSLPVVVLCVAVTTYNYTSITFYMDISFYYNSYYFLFSAVRFWKLPVILIKKKTLLKVYMSHFKLNPLTKVFKIYNLKIFFLLEIWDTWHCFFRFIFGRVNWRIS